MYQGVVAGRMDDSPFLSDSNEGVFFLENEWRPVTEVSRFKITEVPLAVLVIISGILNKYLTTNSYNLGVAYIVKNRRYSLKEWREVRIPHLKQWLDISQKSFFAGRIQFLEESLKVQDIGGVYNYLRNYRTNTILYQYQDAYLQDYYQMTINYEEGQTISFCEKDEVETESALDSFPPMRFCKAASDRSRQYICDENTSYRKGITIDHPFVMWLLENASLLNQFYQRQFQQIVGCLCNDHAEDIIQKCNDIRQQLMSLPERHGIDVSSFPELSMDDFWVMDDSNEH